MVWEINDRYGTRRWQPVHLIKRSLSSDRLAAFYRAADVCIVSSLQDGMNLVAKEFVASQLEAPGVLLLSRFTGAANDLDGFIEVNPYDPEDFARRIRDALTLPPQERSERMRRMLGSLRTIYDWMGDIFRAWGTSRYEHGPVVEASREAARVADGGRREDATK
jgi:trehalose-6-phosphate synthase